MIVFYDACVSESKKLSPARRSRDYNVDEIRRYMKQQRIERRRQATEKPKQRTSCSRRVPPLDTNLHRATKTSPQQKSLDVWTLKFHILSDFFKILTTYLVTDVYDDSKLWLHRLAVAH